MSRDDPQAHGTIVLVQEHRFQLLTDSGERLHCALSPSVPAGPGDLRRLMDEEVVVRVRLRPSPETRAKVVRELWRLDRDDREAGT